VLNGQDHPYGFSCHQADQWVAKDDQMTKLKVYQYKMWDHVAGENKISPRMATRQFIEMAGGQIVSTEREVDSSMVDNIGQADIDIQPSRLV
jgi:hypothetical protein